MNKASFKNADSIRIYFRSAGCFHNYKQKITLRKSDDKNYHLTFCYDTITIEKINGRKMVVKTPVFTYQNVTAVIIDSLFNLVKNSQVQRKKAFETGISCVSTTHENLFILINNSLFQFSDAGLCDWNLYRNFKREFIE